MDVSSSYYLKKLHDQLTDYLFQWMDADRDFADTLDSKVPIKESRKEFLKMLALDKEPDDLVDYLLFDVKQALAKYRAIKDQYENIKKLL